MSDESETSNSSYLVVEYANKLATWRKKDIKYWFKIIAIIDNNKGNIKNFDCYEEYCNDLNIDKFRNTNIYKNTSIISIYEWLKVDNPTFYNTIKCNREELISLINDFNESKVSRIFYNLKPNNYIYVDELGWYSVNENNIWVYNDTTPTHIARDIDDTILNLIDEQCINLNEKDNEILKDESLSRAEKQDKQESISEIKKLLLKLKKKFGKAHLSRSMITYIKSYYNNNDAINLMNSNNNLFACNNKVFDCLVGKWRDIEPTDYIRFNSGYSYYSKRDKTIENNIYKFFNSTFENEEVALYFLSIIARCLYGYRICESAQKFYILLGNGRNGKSLSFQLISRIFNEDTKLGYYHSVEIKEFTKQQVKANEPMPGLANGKSKRIVITTEPEDNEQIQVGTIKKITGGDTLQYRDLFQRGIDSGYKAEYGLFLQTNHKPFFKLDSAFLNRLVVINFPYKFKSEDEIKASNETNPNWKIADDELGKLFNRDDYRLEFLHILVDIFNKYNLKEKAMPMPEKVKEYTKDVIDENNIIGAWLEKNYKPKNTIDINDTTNWIKTTELISMFKADTHIQMSDKEFLSQMEHNHYIVSKATKNISDTIKKNNSIFKGLVRTTPKPMVHI
jgi:hypothetical protein